MWTEEKDRLKIVVFVSMFCIVNLVSEFETRRPAYCKYLHGNFSLKFTESLSQ